MEVMHMLQRQLISSKKIKMMLNNDMIAYEPGLNPSAWNVNINDYDNSHDLRQEARRCVQNIHH